MARRHDEMITEDLPVFFFFGLKDHYVGVRKSQDP